ncbi:hypothetical protein [Flavisolibacter tropicus]|uniref:Uncharacterized protein n=1 Tax=Flavisolibacter tropicus TaxID=1492898 RepID=A0A172TWG7_9BACT|nr:hypothetical protein [Flavisolibacter tropicus]ANE51087.1 hypothetical protein SY85_11825 [Flavisolibacter tropicus]
MKHIKNGFYGFLLGGFVGILAGFGEINMIKKSQRTGPVVAIVVGLTALIGGIVGANYGIKASQEDEIKRIEAQKNHEAYLRMQERARIEKEKNDAIEARLGINKAIDKFMKEGRFWVATTTWRDEEGKEYLLITKKSSEGNLMSSLNDVLVFSHTETSTAQTVLPKCHAKALRMVFAKLRQGLRSEQV